MQALFEIHQDTQSLILDSEIVAIDCTTGSLKSFQALSGRARKDVTLDEVKIPVTVFAFDLIYLDGEVSPSCEQKSETSVRSKTDSHNAHRHS